MNQSHHLFKQANQWIPGGVNSPVRAFKGVGGEPVFFKAGNGPYLFDVDDKRYVDYVGSWGPLILGHCHPKVMEAVQTTLTKGMSFGAPTELEIELAKKVIELVPSIDKVRMVNSGTEATMTAIRLARGITGRDKILKFAGCYHGHSDSLLVKAGSGLLTLGIPSSPGVPAAVAQDTLTVPFNDRQALAQVFGEVGDEIACVIIEPVAGNMGCILPEDGFLQALREHCNDAGSLLIFDEVMTGFRVALGGAQAHFNVRPDLTTLGKVIGGGMPVGAIGGRADLMDQLAPAGSIYQAGTLSGNPIAMSAGLATLTEIEKPEFFETLSQRTQYFVEAMQALAGNYHIPLAVTHIGGMFGLCFTTRPTVTSFEDVASSNIERFKSFFHGMLEEGVYLAPSAFEAGFVSAVHDKQVIEFTLQAADKVFAKMARA